MPRRQSSPRWLTFAALSLAFVITTSSESLAASVPPGVEPGVIERPYKEKQDVPSGDVVIPAPDAPSPPQNIAEISLTLTSVEVVGSSVFNSSELSALFNDLIGKKIKLVDVYVRTASITQKYAEAGYALCIAFLPPQRIQGGKIRIEVVEGFIGEVAYTGTAANIPDIAKSYIDKVKQSKPLRSNDLERYLLLANDVPGVRIRTMFERLDTERGASKLVVQADRTWVQAAIEINNRGSNAVGREQVQADVALNSVLGLGEKLSFVGVQTIDWGELSYIQGRFSVPVGTEGVRLSSSLSYSESNPGTADLDALNFVSNGWTGDIGADYPLLRSREHNLTIGARFTGKVLDSDLLGSTNSSDRIYVASLSASYSHRSTEGQSQLSLAVNQGLDVFNATTEDSAIKSRANGSGEFTTVTLDASHEQLLAPGVSALVSFSAQGASRSLLAAEECGFGAEPFGRGFDPSEIAGDHCVKGMAELRAAPFLLASMPNVFGHLSRTFTAHAFADAGVTWQQGTLFPGEVREESGQSVGGGIRFEAIPRVEVSVEYAQPLSHDVAQEENRDGRVFFSLRASY